VAPRRRHRRRGRHRHDAVRRCGPRGRCPARVGGEAIPLAGFAQITFVATVIGAVLASQFARRADRPRHTFLVTTVALTVVSFVPDVLADAQTSTKLALMVSHVVAAAIAIPLLASRLSD
jgi:hypothetical protein